MDETEPTHPDEPPSPPPEGRVARARRRGRRVYVYTSAAVVVLMLVVLIALIAANANDVRYSWVFGHTHASLVWVILVCWVAGWIAGIATVFVVSRRLRRWR